MTRFWTDDEGGAWYDFDSKEEALKFEEEIINLLTGHGLVPSTNTFWDIPESKFSVLVMSKSNP